MIHLNQKKYQKSAALDALKIIQDALRTRNNEIHALFSFPREQCGDFIKTWKTSSLKFAVYDLSTMEECKINKNVFFLCIILVSLWISLCFCVYKCESVQYKIQIKQTLLTLFWLYIWKCNKIKKRVAYLLIYKVIYKIIV